MKRRSAKEIVNEEILARSEAEEAKRFAEDKKRYLAGRRRYPEPFSDIEKIVAAFRDVFGELDQESRVVTVRNIDIQHEDGSWTREFESCKKDGKEDSSGWARTWVENLRKKGGGDD